MTRDWKELRRFTFESIINVGVSVTLGMATLLAFELGLQYGTKIFWFLGKTLGRRGAEVVLVVFVCAVAWSAYELKKRQQGWYGLTEIVFGVASATNVALAMIPGNSTLTQWVALFASTYVIERGLGNLNEVTSRNKRNAILTASQAPSANP